MKIETRVLLIAFAFSLAIGLLSHNHDYWTMIFPDDEAILRIGSFFSALSWIINPLLLFVTFYFIGKRPETIRGFYSYLFSFFVGDWVGLAIGTFSGTMLLLQSASFLPTNFVIANFFGSFTGSLFSLSFFVGFSALAISYIIKKGK